MNYYNTLIAVAEDSPAAVSRVPQARGGRKTRAVIEYELLAKHPYAYTEEDIAFEVHAKLHDIPKADRPVERKKLLSKGHPHLRVSALARRYGWGLHNNGEGKIALIAVESPQYKQLLVDPHTAKVKSVPLDARIGVVPHRCRSGKVSGVIPKHWPSRRPSVPELGSRDASRCWLQRREWSFDGGSRDPYGDAEEWCRDARSGLRCLSDQTQQAVLDALEAGYRALDTARSYLNEESVGNRRPSARSRPPCIATVDRGESLFFDHRDPKMVSWLGERRLD